jgi:hypothetical protein
VSWATKHISKLQKGNVVRFRPRGNSMVPIIWSGALVTVEPYEGYPLAKNDIVLCKVKGRQYLHWIKAVRGSQYQIGNNHGGINGWITSNSIYGICTDIQK